ncbi:MAG: YdiU family protein [Planctomycetota bacterium]
MPPTSTSSGWRWNHTYAALPDAFYTAVPPTPAPAPSLVVFNATLARSLGLAADRLGGEHGAAIFSGSALPGGAEPIAQAYAGHQFGNFTMLGDGRAILLGEHLTPDDRRVDVQLKGAGRTPYSRGGDGKAALGPMLREHLIGEAMHGLGIPTTRSLAVIVTGEPVYRETELPGAVLTRVADSHLRVGTFEYAARFVGPDAVQALADYAIARHFPEVRDADRPYRALWEAVARRQAELIARWMGVGFVHGVMNTDNVAIAGQTLDYGPCAFLDAYDPAAVFSSIDQFGRYAYGNQPTITRWNLARLAEALLPLFDETPEAALAWAQEAVDGLERTLFDAWLNEMRKKLGLDGTDEGDEALINDWLSWMQADKLDFTNTFRGLSAALVDTPDTDACFASEPFRAWQARWLDRIADRTATAERMRQHNPAFIPRNHRVEAALDAAVQNGDLDPYRRLLAALARPYDDQPKHDELREPAPANAPPYRTFCGT